MDTEYSMQLTYDSIPVEHRPLFWEWLTAADYVLHQNSHWPADTPKFTQHIVFWKPKEDDVEEYIEFHEEIKRKDHVTYKEIQITTDSYFPENRMPKTNARLEKGLELVTKWPPEDIREYRDYEEHFSVTELNWELYYTKKTRDFIMGLNDPSWIVFKFFQDHPEIFRERERMAAIALDRHLLGRGGDIMRNMMEQNRRIYKGSRRSKKHRRINHN